MAYYCLFNGTGYLLGSNVPLLDSGGTSLRINIKKFNCPFTVPTALFSQSSSNRAAFMFVVRRQTSGDIECFWGGNIIVTITAAQLLTAFGNSTLTCDEFGFEWTGTTINLYKDGVLVLTKTGANRGSGGGTGFGFRVGAISGSTASSSTTGSSLANNGATYGDFDLYVNGTLQRSWVMPSTGTTVPNSTSGGVLTQYGTWPSDDSEWVFYSSVTTDYSDTLSGSTFTSSGNSLAATCGYGSTLNGGTYSSSGNTLAATRGYSSVLNSATFTSSGGNLSATRGYSSLLNGGSYSYLGNILTSTYTGASQSFDDTMLGGVYSSSGGALSAFVGMSSVMLGTNFTSAGGSLSSILGYSSNLSGGAYSYSGNRLISTWSGEVTVTIEGYTIMFADDSISALFGADNVSANFELDHVSVRWSN